MDPRFSGMAGHPLDRLLTTLDVRLHAFAVCEIAEGARLNFDAMNVVVVHHILAGSGVLYVKGAPSVAFGPGCILVVPPNVAQSLAASSTAVREVSAADHCSMLDEGLLRFDAADGRNGDLQVICGTITASYGGSFGLFELLTGPIVDDLMDAAPVRHAFELLIAERAAPDFGTHALTEALMKQCLILLVRRHLKRGGPISPLFATLSDVRLGAAVRDILVRPAAPHGLDDLAEVAGMSRSGFAKAFAETFHQTPMDFVLRTRLYKAAQLLRISDLPVKTVAASTGFASRSHFSRAFSAAYGLDPSAFRKQRSGDPEDASVQDAGWLARLFRDPLL